ncbi:T9SS type B sorting domain-containing protein [Leptobacterium flavescens]|uniref:T9SS type B sorting domain-containing protein n=1 Tax=Leptobacterium flavescens TaxID=472055 RepID=A0A6P0UM19_9FLAO|nr:thrombospondin type 3 repeat-containing protein [Leptobacterium flavescens]NER12908.1 T9SS type B sorting domain-containing protein [Leptobacterium flavescens]
MIANLRYVFSITMIFLSFSVAGQSNYWNRISSADKPQNISLQNLEQDGYTIVSLNEQQFRNALNGAPLRTGISGTSAIQVSLPDEKGRLMNFRVFEAPVLSDALSRKYPGIKSYIGYSVENPAVRARFSVSPQEVQSMIKFDDGRTVFMEKNTKNSTDYIVYDRASRTDVKGTICSTQEAKEEKTGIAGRNSDDQTLRRYRLAVSTTGEYTSFHGGTVAGALAAINATVTRVNEVFETDLGISFEVIANTDTVIYTDAATDPYGTSLTTELQATLNSEIGAANYDIGHLFHQASDNGNAGCIGCVCVDNRKGSGFSATTMPTGDFFDIDYVAHEIGHQFGANHTWSFESEGTGVNVEPASGTTIMAYAGITGQNNVQLHSDPYFHYLSIFQISNFVAGTNCDVEIPLSNNPPNANAGNDYIIPRSTAFVLTGTGTDPDAGDVLSYTWEQVDDGVITNTTFGPTNTLGANFRSLPPTASPVRYMPALSRVLSGDLTQTNPTLNDAWETVSDVGRGMNFAFTVRDNVVGGGQTRTDQMRVTVDDNSGPFLVSSHSSALTLTAGEVETILWDVANTSSPPVNTTEVDILLSTDGGLTYPVTLAQNVTNDGQHNIIVPGGISTSSARIMVRASNNIFFAVNSSDLSIQESEFVLNFPSLEMTVCQPDDLVVNFTYNTFLGFNEETTFSASDLPAGLGVNFVPTSATADGTNVQMTFTNTAGVTPGVYTIPVNATSASVSKSVDFTLEIFSSSLADVTLTSPANGTTDAFLNQTLQWQADPFADEYDVQVATDAGFSNIVASETLITNSYVLSDLNGNTTYYWRVRSRNSCGTGNYSAAFNFSTAVVNCKVFTASDVPVTIPANQPSTVNSFITVPDDLPITDIKVTVDITHTFVSDLTLRLISPQGTTIVLLAQACDNNQDIQATFDDGGSAVSCSPMPAVSGIVMPLQPLSQLFGESAAGNWRLEVEDAFNLDGGAINTFSLEVCVAGEFTPDIDADGVLDNVDNCVNTPNPDQADNDNDGMGDVCDPDDDNDGILDIDDNCPFAANADQADNDNDGIGDVCDTDDDNDGILDVVDNCPLTANADQADNDNDGIGDVCDPDDDNDGIADENDNCALNFNPDQLDIDNDGEGDVCDEDVLVSEAFTPNGDSINDTWQIVNIHLYPNAVISVFNRQGTRVYRTVGYNNDWNGVYKSRSEKLPAGSYYYQIDLTGDGNVDLKGWVYITY